MSNNTINKDYTYRLTKKQYTWWKNLLDVQRPYRYNINKLNLGFTLDLGCGIGRNLLHLKGNGVGIDHNESSIEICKEKGLIAYTNDAFKLSEYSTPKKYDSILLAHVVEHLTELDAYNLIKEHLYLLKENGKIVVITPQEAGYKSDATHVKFVNFEDVKRMFEKLNLKPIKHYSFPFPRIIGKVFKYNEFISVAKKQ